MATYTTEEAASDKAHVGTLISSLFYNQRLAFWVLDENDKVMVDGGTHISYDAFYGENPNVQWYSGYDTLDSNDYEFADKPVLDWKQFDATTSISGIQSAMNQGKKRLFDLETQKLKNTCDTMTREFGKALYSDGTAGTGCLTTKQLSGLALAIGDGTNSATANLTYAGISRATYTWWEAQTDDTTTRITLDTFEDLLQDIQQYGVGDGIAAFTTPKQFRVMKAQISAPERVVYDERVKKMASYGSKAIEYLGIPIMWDPQCPTTLSPLAVTGITPAATMWLVNRNYVKLVGLENYGDDFGMQDSGPTVRTDGDQAYVTWQGWKYRPWQVPINQDAKTSHFMWYGNLANFLPLASGAFRILSES
jgi:hypothetical protein